MVKVSVIVPVYNVEKYLRQCLDSIVNQTLGDIEIICVNDGSTDSSLNILKEYEKSDSRITIISQENKGLGASRNVALNKAQGEFVYFADSDDYLNLTALEQLTDFAKDKSPDYIMFKINNFYDETGELDNSDPYYTMPHLKKRVGENSFKYEDVSDFAIKLCVCAPGSLFRREFIKDIRFPENILYEDNVFFTKALFNAQKIYFYDEFLYNRRIRSESITSEISLESLDMIEISTRLLDLCDEYNHKTPKRNIYYRIFNITYKMLKQVDSSQKELFFNKLKSEYVRNKDRWENDDYFKNDLNPKYKHRFYCALKANSASQFKKCTKSYSKESKFKKLRKKLL